MLQAIEMEQENWSEVLQTLISKKYTWQENWPNWFSLGLSEVQFARLWYDTFKFAVTQVDGIANMIVITHKGYHLQSTLIQAN